MEQLFTDGKYSHEHHDSASQPFFTDHVEGTGKPVQKLEENELALSDIILSEELENLYRFIGNPCVEYYFDGCTIMSLKNVIKSHNIMVDHGQSRVIDFAFWYEGMGHVIVDALDPSDGQIFYRHDGGSNGYDRKNHFEFICKYVPKNEDKVSFASFAETVKQIQIPIIVIN